VAVWLTSSAAAQSHQSPNTLKLDRPGTSPKARIADIAWLEGSWTGTGLGGEVEELWGAPIGNSMLGTFRLVKNGQIVVCEILTIKEIDGSLVLKVKHFDSNLVGREEKDACLNFPLVKLDQAEANFDGLTYRKTNDGNLVAYVMIDSKNGKREEPFHFRAAKTGTERRNGRN
jgi:hypothetical protein